MYSLYGMTGLGSNGMGAADSPQISPQILQMLLSGASGSPLGGMASPMANAAPFQGLPQHQAPMGAMMPQMPAGTGQQPQQGQQQGGLLGSGVSQDQLIKLLTGGAQQGVSPLQNPNNGPSILGNLLRGYSANGLPGQGVLNGLSQQAANNVATAGPGGMGYGNGVV